MGCEVSARHVWDPVGYFGHVEDKVEFVRKAYNGAVLNRGIQIDGECPAARAFQTSISTLPAAHVYEKLRTDAWHVGFASVMHTPHDGTCLELDADSGSRSSQHIVFLALNGLYRTSDMVVAPPPTQPEAEPEPQPRPGGSQSQARCAGFAQGFLGQVYAASKNGMAADNGGGGGGSGEAGTRFGLHTRDRFKVDTNTYEWLPPTFVPLPDPCTVLEVKGADAYDAASAMRDMMQHPTWDLVSQDKYGVLGTPNDIRSYVQSMGSSWSGHQPVPARSSSRPADASLKRDRGDEGASAPEDSQKRVCVGEAGAGEGKAHRRGCVVQ